MQPIVPYPRPDAPRFSKARRAFLDPIAQEKNNPRFLPPPPTNNVNFDMSLEAIIPQVEGKFMSAFIRATKPWPLTSS